MKKPEIEPEMNGQQSDKSKQLVEMIKFKKKLTMVSMQKKIIKYRKFLLIELKILKWKPFYFENIFILSINIRIWL